MVAGLLHCPPGVSMVDGFGLASPTRRLLFVTDCGMMNTSPGSTRQARKEQKGSTMDIKAISDSTNETIEVTPVALQDIPGYSDYSALAIFDAKTGSPLYQDYSYDWRLLPAEEGYDTEDAETIHDIYGEDEDSWETAANKGLEDYGLKLGKFVDTFDFEVAGRRYDGYMLDEI